MEKYFNFFAVMAIATFSLVSCDKESRSSFSSPEITVNPSGKIILDEAKKTETALTVSWTAVSENAGYIFYMTSAKSQDISEGAFKKDTEQTSVTFTGEELQEALIGLGFKPGTNASVRFVVQASYGSESSESAANASIVLYTHTVILKVPGLALTSENIVLSEDAKADEALKISWTDASVEEIYVEYTLSVTKAEDKSFVNAVSYDVADAFEKSFTGNELQFLLRDMGFNPGETASVICRVEAVPSDGTVESVVSEPKSFSVKLFEKPKNTDIPASVTVLGDGTEFGWNMDAADAQLTCTDAVNGIFTGEINLTTDTFKFYFDKKWNKGPKPGEGDYYWSDITIPETLGDNDYFRVLLPGRYSFVLNASDVTIECRLVEASVDEVRLHGQAITGTDESGDATITAKDKSKGIYEGVVNLVAGKTFSVIPGKDRGYYCHPSSKSVGTSWKIVEDREKTKEFEEMGVADSGEYKVTIDFVNHTMTAVPVL